MAFSTNYPPYNFHSTLWNTRERRDFFPDCGSLCGVHVDETGKATVQKEHNSCKGEHLYAKFSSLPLFQKPNVLQENDAIGIHNLHYINKKMTSLHKRLTLMKTLCHQDATWQNYLMETLKALYATEENNVTETGALKMFYANNYLRNFYETLGKFLDVQNVWHSNHKFIGGCLETLNFSNQADSTISLAAITGPDFKTIKIITPKINDSSLLSLEEKSVHEIKVNDEMFDLSCQTLYDTTYCLSRTVDKCFLFEINYDDDGTSSSLKNTLQSEGRTYTSVNLSPYILGECLVADHTNSVFLWDSNGSLQNVVNQHPHRFPCKSNWCNVHYASHPRSFVLTNQSAMELMDIRTSCNNSSDIFALPNKYLSKDERISASCCSRTNPFHHFVATNHALFLIDERFLGHPVLQWQHMLEGIPHYLSPIQGAVQSSGDEVLLAASQFPNEAICVQYRTNPNHPPVSMCSPWRISRPGDLYFIEKFINQIKDVVVHERLSDPIIGVAGEAINSEGMYVFQLNSLGDIFYQAYGVSNVYEDKTCSAGPGDSIVKHSEEIINISKNWLEHLENQLEEKYSRHMKTRPSYEVKGIFEIMKGHVLCQLCMPQCHNDNVDSDDDEIITGVCEECNTSLLTSKHLLSAIEVDGIMKSSGISYNATPPSIDNLTGENKRLSKKLYKHWYDVEMSSSEEEEEGEEEEKKVEEKDNGSDDMQDSANSTPKETPTKSYVRWSDAESSNGNYPAAAAQVDKEFGERESQLVVSSPTHLQSSSQQTVSPTVKEISSSLPTYLQKPEKHETPHKTNFTKLSHSQLTTFLRPQTFDSSGLSPPLSQTAHSKNFSKRKSLFTTTDNLLKSPTFSSMNQLEDGFSGSPTHIKRSPSCESFLRPQTFDSSGLSPPLSQTAHSKNFSKRKSLFTTDSVLKSPTFSSTNQFEDGFSGSQTHIKRSPSCESFKKSPSIERELLFSQQLNPFYSFSSLTSVSQPVKIIRKQKYEEGF